jgi:carbamoyl-phosphate synthase large subunit
MKYRVMITGVGSLVGKGILDALEGRRDALHIIGTYFGEPQPALWRCDEVVRTEASQGPALTAELRAVVARARPDLVIPGRDPDVPAVADFGRAACAGHGAQVASDKWLTYQFSGAQGLPTVHTALPGQADFGPPAISKPRCGGGSVGVRLLLTEQAWEMAQMDSDTILQPLIGDVPQVPDPDLGMPLFYSASTARQGGVQALVGPDGELGPMVAFEALHRFGIVAEQHLLDDPELLSVGQAYALSFARAGWRGPLNVSCIHDGQRWLCLEINPRFSGGTAARTLLGFDEVGWIINRWAGSEVVPPLPDPCGDVVVQQVSALPMWSDGRGL